jgi:hypothetical protein
MSEALSPLRDMIDGMKRKVAFHQERETFHAEQEEHHARHQKRHGEERARHQAELAAATQHLAELQAMAERVGAMTQASALIPPETGEQRLGRHPNASKAIDQVLATWPPEVPFSATTLAGEIERRYSDLFRRPIHPRAVASGLRRRRDAGLLEEIREGRPFQEALYRKRPRQS